MKITIEIIGREAVVICGSHKEVMNKNWLLKQFKLNDLYEYLKQRQ